MTSGNHLESSKENTLKSIDCLQGELNALEKEDLPIGSQDFDSVLKRKEEIKKKLEFLNDRMMTFGGLLE